MGTLKKARNRITVMAASCVMLLLSTASPAAAGCLLEYDTCGECARSLIFRAALDFDLEGLEEAYLYGLDCDIDLFHCIMLGQHHNYRGCRI